MRQLRIGEGEIGIELDGRGEVGDGGVELIIPQVGESAIIEGGSELGIEAQGLVIVGYRAVILAFFEKGMAAVVECGL